MATPEELKQQLESFNKELDKIQQKIIDVGGSLGNNLTGKLTESVVAARRLSDPLKSAKSLSEKLNKLSDENEVLIIKRKVAEENYVKALKSGIPDLIKAKETEFKRLSAELGIKQRLEDQLKTLQGIAESEERITEEKKKQNNLSNFAASKFKEIKKQLEAFFSLATLFKAIIDGALRFSKISTDIGKNLGYGADNANRVAKNMIDTAQSALNVNVTFQNLADAANELSTATGFVAEYSADALETQIMLTKQFGLQADEAAGIYKLSLLTGKSSKAVNDAMVGAFVATRNQLKVGIPFRATIAEAAKVSGRLAANLQNNPEQIVKAVSQAKALGTSLEQVAKQGESLLNFESSIENELKAELLTGKQLNLERARAAALAGDQVALAEELNKNVGTLDEFQRMNVLQQKAMAEAVGLTADELADQLRKQKMAQEQGKSLAQITKEEALAAEQRQATQDKFNQAILKLQDFFGNLLAGPLGQFLEMLTKSLDVITIIASTLGVIWVTQKAIAAIEGLKLGYQVASNAAKSGELTKEAALKLMKKEELATQIGIAAAWAVANPFTALAGLAAAAAVAGGIYALTKKGDDIFSEGGYGKRTLLAPEGAIRLNDNDTVIAGTDLGGGGGMSGGSIDLTPMIAAINEVKIAVNQLMNRPVIVNMDSKQVGSSLVQASPKSA